LSGELPVFDELLSVYDTNAKEEPDFFQLLDVCLLEISFDSKPVTR